MPASSERSRPEIATLDRADPEAVLLWLAHLGDGPPPAKRVNAFCKKIAGRPDRPAVIARLVAAVTAGDCTSNEALLLILTLLSRARDHGLALDLTAPLVDRPGESESAAAIRASATALRGQSLLLSGCDEAAMAHVGRHAAMLCRSRAGRALLSWRAWKAGDMAECARHFRASNHKQLPVLGMRDPDLSPRSGRAVPQGSIKVLTTTYNEIELIAQFLRHYREAGPAHFLVVDNGSTDGTAEFLADQPDVTLYTTPESFGRSGFGSSWVNALLRRHTRDTELCIRVDADEFLVHGGPGGLADFLSACNAEAADIVAGVLVDMFPADPSYSAPSARDPGERTLAEAVWFDADIRTEPALFPPYRIDRGGFRARVFQTTTNLTKSPIIRGGGQVLYLNANHGTTPGRIAQRRCALLHYKLTPGSRSRYVEQIARGEHHGAGVRYRKFLRLIGRRGDIVADVSRKYAGPADLEAAGLL